MEQSKVTYSYAWETLLYPGRAEDFFPAENPPPLEGHRGKFNRSTAWWLSEMSRLIYVKSGPIAPSIQTAARNRFLHRVKLEESWFYNGKHLQCAIVQTRSGNGSKYAVLVFRGTQRGISNWLLNLSGVLSPWPGGGRVHRGFKKIFLESWPLIQAGLDQLQRPFFYTGHSLGGSLAVLAASLQKPEAVYTFGSPRIGDGAFCTAVRNLDIYRVVNPRDIVATMPFPPGMWHIGQTHRLNRSKDCKVHHSWFEAPGFLADHSPFNYTVQL